MEWKREREREISWRRRGDIIAKPNFVQLRSRSSRKNSFQKKIEKNGIGEFNVSAIIALKMFL